MSRLAILTLLCALASPAFAEEPAQPFLHIKRGPTVQRVTSDSAVICWRTMGKSVPSLRYGVAPDRLDHIVPAEKIAWGASCWAEAKFEPGVFITGPMIRAYRGEISDTGGTYQYVAVLTGLKPQTRTCYAVYHKDTLIGGGTAEDYVLTYPPHGSDAPIRLWVTGNACTGGLGQALSYAAMRDRVAQDGRALDALIQVGFGFAGARGTLVMDRFFQPYADTLRHTCAWPTPAADDPWDVVTDSFALPEAGECGGVPSGSRLYYAFEIGATHVVMIVSRFQTMKPEEQAALLDWVKRDLAAARADAKVRHILVFFHDSPDAEFKQGRQTLPNKVKTDLMPLLDGPDLTVINAADLTDRRSLLLDISPDGIARIPLDIPETKKDTP